MKNNNHARKTENGDALRPKWLKILLSVAWALVMLGAIAVAFCKFSDVMMRNHQFVETFYIVQSDKIGQSVRTVHLSDLHQKEFGKDNKTLIDRVRALKPDFISMTGDMLTYGKNGHEGLYALCRELSAIAPTYFSYGNHELDEILLKDVDLKTALEQCGVTVLSREFTHTAVKGNDLVIGGLSQMGGGIEQYSPGFIASFVAEEGFRLLLTHYPSNFDGWIENQPIDLALCGHEHGGIVRLPMVGALYSKVQGLLPKLTEGLHRLGNSTVIISRGLGDSSAVPRVNNPPELVVIDLIGNTVEFNYQ